MKEAKAEKQNHRTFVPQYRRILLLAFALSFFSIIFFSVSDIVIAQYHPPNEIAGGNFSNNNFEFPLNLYVNHSLIVKNGDFDLNNNALTNVDWSTSDTGSGSGLDADTLDNQNGAYYLDNTDYCGSGSCSGAISAATLDTGQGANELYDMNQNVLTTSNPTFNRVYLSDYGYALGGFHVGGTSDPTTDNLVVDGRLITANIYGPSSFVIDIGSGDLSTYLSSTNTYVSGDFHTDGTTYAQGNFDIGAYTYTENNVYVDDGATIRLYDSTSSRYIRILHSNNGNTHIDSYGGGSIYLGWFGTSSGVKTGNGASGYGPSYAASYPGTSDRRLKQNITELNNSLDKIIQLEGVSFYWKDKNTSENKQIGVIAQDVLEVFPEVVVYNEEEDVYFVEYAHLVAPLIESIKEMKKEKDTDVNRLNEIKESLITKSQLLNEEYESLDLEYQEMKSVVCLKHPENEICID